MKFIIVLFALAAVCAAVEDVPIIRSTSDIEPDGSFRFGYETGDGTSHDASGNADGVQGRYSYKSPDGETIEVAYTANENGFDAQGSHIPAIPEHILRALEWNRNHPEEEE